MYDGYGHDPVCLAGAGYAVHRGAGIAFLHRDGSVERETKVGRFNWGPPSLSVSPDGSTVAWIRWKGDLRKLCLEDVASGQSRQLATAVYDYAWLDSATVLYRLGAGPRLLDVATGRTRRFGHQLRDQIRATTDPTPDLAALAGLPADETWELYFGLQAVDDTGWLAAGLGARRSSEHANRATGFLRTDTTGTRIELAMAVAENELIQHFHALPDGSAVVKVAVYEDMTIVERRRIAIGPLASFLDDGWHPMATSQTPAMGFHADALTTVNPRQHSERRGHCSAVGRWRTRYPSSAAAGSPCGSLRRGPSTTSSDSRGPHEHHPPRAARTPPSGRRQKVQSVIEQTRRLGGDLSVSAIARAAGVDRSYLYRHPDLLRGLHQAQTSAPDPIDGSVSRSMLQTELANAQARANRLHDRVR